MPFSLLINVFAAFGLFSSVFFTYLVFDFLREQEEDGLLRSAVSARLECGLCRKQSDKKISYPFNGDSDKTFLEKHRNCKPGETIREERQTETKLATEGA